MTDKQVQIKFEGNAAGVKTASGVADQSLNIVQKSAAAVEAALAKMGQAQASANAQAASVASNTAAAGQAQATFAAQTAQAEGQTQKLSARLGELISTVMGGQASFMQIAQQGGQLAGALGGMETAAGGVTAAVGPATIGLGLLGAVAAGAGYAFYKGSQESKEFNRSLVLTGNYAGLVAGQMDEMAIRLARSNGTTVGGMRETLQTLVSSGQFAREAMEPAAQAIETIAALSGKTRAEVTKSFDGMSGGVAKFAAKINETYHFMSYAQYKHVQQLEEEGKAVEAQAETFKILNTSLGKVTDNLGTVEHAWNAIKTAASGAINAMLGIGRDTSNADKLAAIEAQLEVRRNRKTMKIGRDQFDQGTQALETEKAKLVALIESDKKAAQAKSEYAQAQEAAIKVDEKWERQGDKLLTKQGQLNKELKEARDMAAKGHISPEALAQRERDIRSHYAPTGPKGPSPEAIAKAQLKLDVAEITQQLAVMTDAYANADRILQAQHAAGQVDEQTYYAAKVGMLKLTEAAQVAALEAENKRIKAEKANDKDLLENKRQIAANEAKMTKIRQDAATQIEVLGIQEQAQLNNVARAYAEARMAAQEFLDTTRRQNQRSLDAMGMSDKARFNADGRNQIDDRYGQQLLKAEQDKQLKQALKTWTPLDQDTYEKQIALIKEFHEKASAGWDKYFEDIGKKEANWVNGATKAIANYADSSANMMRQTENLFVKAFSGMEDALVNFTKTGKLDFRSMADSIITDLIRIQIRAAMASAVGNGSGLMGFLGNIFGGSAASSGGTAVNGSAGSIPVIDSLGYAVAHTGGVIGSDSLSSKTAHPSVFSGAPRFHSGGITGDEVPIIAQRGEGVFTPAQMRALAPVGAGGGNAGPISVTIVNQTGQAANATARQTEGGGIEVLLTAVKESIAEDIGNGTGPVNAALSSRYNLRPSMA